MKGALGEICQQARAILKQHKPQCLHAMLESERKRPFEHNDATDRYCAAVVQHTEQLGHMPSYLEYIEEVCHKRPALRTEEDEAMGEAEAEDEDDSGTGVADDGAK